MFGITQILIALVLSFSSPVSGLSGSGVVSHDADPRWTDTINSALDLFTGAGLVAPSPDIHVHLDTEAADCLGHPAVFTVPDAGPRIDICIPYLDSKLGTNLRNKMVLHELGHAWTHQNLDTVTREAFMEVAGSSAWNDHNQADYTRGTERAANAIAYGLLPDPPPNNTNTCGFELLTGTPLPNGESEHCR